MSTIALDLKIFASVRNKLQSMASGSVIDHDHPGTITTALGLRGYSCNDIYAIQKKDKAVEILINRLYEYNDITCELHEYHKKDSETIKEILSACDDIHQYEEDYMAKMEPAKISVEQCYKYLQCIGYNIDLEGWGGEQYFSTELWQKYRQDMATLKAIVTAIAFHLADEVAEQQGCKWANI